MAGSEGHSAGATSIEALKELKQLETESEQKLKAAVEAGERTLRQLREEAEAVVHAARQAAERTREETLQRARATVQAEADRVIADGEKVAAQIVPKTAAEIRRTKEKILQAVLAGFRSSSGSGA